MSKIVIGIMGPGKKPTEADLQNAYDIGKWSAESGYITLTGGHGGVMEAGLKGAKDAGGTTLAIITEGDKAYANQYADIVIPTGIGEARNAINVTASDVLIATGLQAGTLNEVSMSIKLKKPTIVVTEDQITRDFFGKMCPDASHLHIVNNAKEAIPLAEKLLREQAPTLTAGAPAKVARPA